MKLAVVEARCKNELLKRLNVTLKDSQEQEQDQISTLESPDTAGCQDLGVNRTGKSLVPSPADLYIGIITEINGQMSPGSVSLCLLLI